MNQLNQDVSGHYKLGCHASVAQYTLPKILPSLMQKHPKLEFQLFHDLSRNICEKIISFEIDFGIVVNPIPHPDLVIKELTKDTVHFWVSEKGAKSNSKTLIIDPQMLQAQDLLKRTKNKSFSFERVISTPNLELIAQLTEAGGGIGIIPKKVVEGRNSKLKIFDEALPHFTDSINMVYRADLPKSVATKEIVSAIMAWPH